MSKKDKDDEESNIKQGTIAEFMRKRTQLVGFEFGYWKHTQYLAEFLDNALDAIEFFQWEEIKKPDSRFKFTLNKELSLEKLSILDKDSEIEQPLDEEGIRTLSQEIGIEPINSNNVATKRHLNNSGNTTDKAEFEVEEEVRIIIEDMEQIIKPVEMIIDVEPIVIIRVTESEAASFLTSELSQKNVMKYSFEIFDNGTGMSKADLKKFGKYLASSKSMQLRQTRGSQGFGAPSAFSDSQNTTGKPIIAVSKSTDNVYATVSEFFTTSENEKKYLIPPTDIDSPFLHGTYIKLNYLNVKYVRGYAETYIKETSLMNPHITIIYIDPLNEEHIYPRKVPSFPEEPKYALAHPSSINIGDLQDLLSKSENNTLTSFLKDNFVRISSKIAKEIVDLAERDLQDKKNLLILSEGYVSIPETKSSPVQFLRYEKRVFGRSQKPRDFLVIFEVASEELKNSFWSLISKYNQLNKDQDKINKQIKKHRDELEKKETEKERKSIKKDIGNLLQNIDSIINEKEKTKLDLNKLFKNNQKELTELKNAKNRTDLENLVSEVEISKAKSSSLTNDQFNILFQSFKSIKYMAPPTDTAIPVGESTLENTLIKDLGLRVSGNLDYFDTTTESIYKSSDILLQEKTTSKKQKEKSISKENIQEISINLDEIVNFNSQILNTVNLNNQFISQIQYNQLRDQFFENKFEETPDTYHQIFEYYLENYTKDDDFVSAETREPTSGKGLAYVVEAVMTYSELIEVPKRSRDVLSRFVNRTPKLRDNSDCAITKAVQSVNWKNYKLDLYDNNLPKGPIKLLVNVSGPFVHLMFKSQSKNALADDENLIKEIKYCLEAIGRRLRIYLNRRAIQHKSEKRASVIEKYIPKFVKSISNIASRGNGRVKNKVDEEELQRLMRDAIGKKTPPSIKAQPIEFKPDTKILEKTDITLEPIPDKIDLSQKDFDINAIEQWMIKDLKQLCDANNIKYSPKISKTDLINLIKEKVVKAKLPLVEEIQPTVVIEEKLPSAPMLESSDTDEIQPRALEREIASKAVRKAPKPKEPIFAPKTRQTSLPIITTDSIIDIMTDEWQTIKHLIFKLKIKDMMDARFLQIKLKELERKDKVLVDVKKGKKHWKLNK